MAPQERSGRGSLREERSGARQQASSRTRMFSCRNSPLSDRRRSTAMQLAPLTANRPPPTERRTRKMWAGSRLPDRARRNCGGRARCNAHHLTNRAPGMPRLRSARILRSGRQRYEFCSAIRIEIHHDEDDVVARRRHFAVKEDRFVVGRDRNADCRRIAARDSVCRIRFKRVMISLIFPGAFQSRSLN